jgi:acyl-CoA thioesterase
LEALGHGRYAGHLGPAWNCPIVPHGGMLTAVAARAMQHELGDDEQVLRSCSAVFAGQVAAGDLDADVTVLRRGRSISQCSVTVRNPGADAGLTAIAVFGASREGFSFTDLAPPPGVPPVTECPSFRDDPPEDVEMGPPFPFWEHVEGRPAIGHPPWEDYEPQSSLLARWIRFDDPPRADDGTWDPLAVLALCDTMPGAVGEKLGPVERQRRWLPPSADFTVHMFDDCRAEWILGVNRARHAGDGYASVDMEMWDMDGDAPRLVVYATQVMFFSFPRD